MPYKTHRGEIMEISILNVDSDPSDKVWLVSIHCLYQCYFIAHLVCRTIFGENGITGNHQNVIKNAVYQMSTIFFPSMRSMKSTQQLQPGNYTYSEGGFHEHLVMRKNESNKECEIGNSILIYNEQIYQ